MIKWDFEKTKKHAFLDFLWTILYLDKTYGCTNKKIDYEPYKVICLLNVIIVLIKNN